MQDHYDFSARTILVTGASSGIGKQIALDLARLGATLVLTGRDTARLEETAAACAGSGHRTIAGDMADKAFLDTLVAALPPLDGLLHAAGGLRGLVPFRMINEKHFDETLDINMNAPIWLTQKLLKARKINDGASLVYVSAMAAYSTPVASAIYSAAKAGLIAAIRSLGQELTSRRIRSNALALGYVASPMTDTLNLSRESMAQQTPLGVADPADVSGPALYLLSSASRWVTRQVLVVDGGVSLKYNISV